MSIGRTWSVTLVGVEGHVIEVEADLALGIPGLTMVGLPDAALQEARDRVRAAIANSGEDWPQRKITLGLSPATLPKAGSGFDLGIAVAVLAAAGRVPAEPLRRLVLFGELGLDGQVRPVRGVLPAVLAAAAEGFRDVVVPVANADEARLVPGVQVRAVPSLRALLRGLREGWSALELDSGALMQADEPGARSRLRLAAEPPEGVPPVDLAEVAGQPEARRAAEVAAAGGHHLFLTGPPGAGKTMIAQRLPGLLPRLQWDEALEVSAVHSVAGLLKPGEPLVTQAPLRAPHHTATVVSLIGGGSSQLRPGEVSCAHRGVLFLDEAPEFHSGVLDALRQPLESGYVDISRSRGSARFPARFLLVLASNPCPCARGGVSDLSCTCPPASRRRYQSKLSGPLLDRVDLRVTVAAVRKQELLADVGRAESTEVVAGRVAAARAAAAQRLAGTPWRTSGEVPGPELRKRWPLGSATRLELERHLERGTLTARGLDRVLRVSWTLADLAGRAAPGSAELGEALHFRMQGLAAA